MKIVHYPKKGTIIEKDADDSEFVYITIKGTVDYKMFKYDTKATVIIATYREGDVFGDASIQR